MSVCEQTYVESVSTVGLHMCGGGCMYEQAYIYMCVLPDSEPGQTPPWQVTQSSPPETGFEPCDPGAPQPFPSSWSSIALGLLARLAGTEQARTHPSSLLFYHDLLASSMPLPHARDR